MSHDEAHAGEAIHTFEWTDFDSPSTATVTTVSELRDEDPASVEPLSDAVDGGALDALFSPAKNAGDRLDDSVEFTYAGYRIVLCANGRGHVFERRRSRSAEPAREDV